MLVAAALVSLWIVVSLRFGAPIGIVNDTWDGPLIVVAGLLWIGWMISRVHDAVVHSVCERLDENAEFLDQVRATDIEEIRQQVDCSVRQAGYVRRLLDGAGHQASNGLALDPQLTISDIPTQQQEVDPDAEAAPAPRDERQDQR